MTDAFQQQLAERAEQLDRLRAASAANRDRPPSTWAGTSDFPFLAAFDRDEVDDFSRDLTSALLDAEERGTLERWEGKLEAWRSTAEIYENPELYARLTEPVDPTQIVEVFPPSEEQVRAAEAEE
jgi:hypothetical protein